MKRNLMALCLCLLLFGVAEAQSSNIRVGDAFRGPIKSARIECATISQENGEYKEGPRVLNVTMSYAPDWSGSEYVGYNRDGSISQKIITTYNADGGQASVSTFDGADKLTRKVVYAYKDGKLVEESRYEGDGSLKQRRVLTWDDSRAGIIEVAYYDGSGALTRKEVNTREAQKSVWTTYNADGTVAEESVHYLNNGGERKTETTRYNRDGSVADKFVSQVDAKVSRIEQADYNRGGALRRKTSETREYDSHGNLSKLTNYAWDEATGKFQPVAVSYYTIIYSETR